MIAQLRKIFGSEPAVERLLEGREPVELATAALLVELARSDFSTTKAELQEARQLLIQRFGLDAQAVDTLVADAAARADRAVSLHEFTHRLNRELAESDKQSVIEMLWRVSLADGHIDKHEEHLIKRVAALLHVSDRDRIRLKLKVLGQL